MSQIAGAARAGASSLAGPALALFAWLAATAWLRPLALPDEGRYVGIAWEMLRSGNWMVPTLDTLPYFHKPPLFYWLTAASMATFGVNEWAARLPSVLAATGSALGLYVFVRRWVDVTYARITLLVLATTPFFFGGAQFANLDMLVAACVAGTILCAADAVLAAEDDRPRRSTLAGAYLFAALGVLAKGLIGIAIPGLVIAIWLVVIGRPMMMLRLVWLPGLALFAIITVPWFALMQARYPEFLHYFFIHHHFERFASTGFNGRRPFWFYVPIFAGFTVPWIAFLVPGLRQGADRQEIAPPVRSLMWIWMLATLVFFSIPSSKLPGYVMVAVPPLALLVAQGLWAIARQKSDPQGWAVRAVAGAAVFCVALVGVGQVYERGNARQLAVSLRGVVPPDGEIVALRQYPFSLPFYLRHRRPIGVVEDWDNPLLMDKDTWRKELHEAVTTFHPVGEKAILIKPKDLARHLACARGDVWVIAAKEETARHPELATLQQISLKHGLAAWHKPPASTVPADCGP